MLTTNVDIIKTMPIKPKHSAEYNSVLLILIMFWFYLNITLIINKKKFVIIATADNSIIPIPAKFVASSIVILCPPKLQDCSNLISGSCHHCGLRHTSRSARSTCIQFPFLCNRIACSLLRV